MTARLEAAWERACKFAPLWTAWCRQHKELRRLNSELIAAVEDNELAVARVLDALARAERAERRAEEAERQAADLRGQLVLWLDERVRGVGPAEGE